MEQTNIDMIIEIIEKFKEGFMNLETSEQDIIDYINKVIEYEEF